MRRLRSKTTSSDLSRIAALGSPTPSTLSFSIAMELPPDVLYYIFVLAQAGASDPRHLSTTVSHVCQLWRAVALRASILWTSVSFDSDRSQFDDEALFLERSREASLEIEITGQPFDTPGTSTTRLRAILALIRPHSHRWRVLKVSGLPPRVFTMLFDDLRSVDAPALETLIVTQQAWTSRADWTFRPFESGTPSLRDLRLKKVPWDFTAPLFNNLQKLILDGIPGRARALDAEALYTVVERSPELEEVHIWPFPTRAGEPGEPLLASRVPPIRRDRLKKLHIDSPATIEALLSVVLVPSLLRFPPLYHMRPELFPIICRLNPLTSLRELTITGPDGPNPEFDGLVAYLPEMLRALDLLEGLNFYYFDFRNRWLKCLETSCPHLKQLALTGCAGFTAESLQRVMAHRMEAEEMRPLDTLWIVDCQDLTMEQDLQNWLAANLAHLRLA
ncbi:hypothetical protein FS837_001785 [Tulasnella sp. UAMH 9824]|nr:hypothetical protein FS837_001785 [Tulasnella sp. UAMH 9824]